MNQIRGVVFDCDGVLFESRQANLAYYNTILSHFGAPCVDPKDLETAHVCHTAASPEVFKVLLGPARVDEALAFAGTLDFRTFIPFMTPEPDLVESLAALSAGMPLAVATNRGGSMSEILKHFDLERYFTAVVTSRDVLRPKPYPDMLNLAACRLGVDAKELLFVGDSDLDRRAAQGAGIRFAAYKWEGTGDLRVDGHRELVAWVEESRRLRGLGG